MRKLIVVAGLAALLVGCSKRDESPRSGDLQTFDTSEAAPTNGRAPPAIGPTAAPGVVFRYNYDFQLADEKISAVQEAHAAKCEALGVARCRITGLNYSIGDNDTVSASLELKLARDLARSYGREAAGAVAQAGGRLSHTEFTGEDTAPSTENAVTAQGDAQQRIGGIEQRLAANSRDAERAQLQAELASLQQTIAGSKAQLADNRVHLASTPLSFSYYGKGGISGFAGRDPLFEAGQSFVGSLVMMITFVLQLLAVVVPWLLLLGVFILLWRTPPARALVRWWRTGNRKDVQDEVAAGATPD